MLASSEPSCLSKSPGTVCLGAAALCAARALPDYIDIAIPRGTVSNFFLSPRKRKKKRDTWWSRKWTLQRWEEGLVMTQQNISRYIYLKR